MKIRETKRSYRMRARAEAAERTGRAILAAAAALWRERALDELTLKDIADRAGVTVQTVIRRFGSKEGVVEACIRADAAEVEAVRSEAPVGDIERAVAVLLMHYERDGDAVLRTLALEEKLEAARVLVAEGRAGHRAWCARVFGPYLPDPGADGYEEWLDAFVAATDVYVWKLLRRDLGRSEEGTRGVLRGLVEALADGRASGGEARSPESGAIPD